MIKSISLRFLATTFLIGSSYASLINSNDFGEMLKGDSRDVIRTLYNAPMSTEEQAQSIETIDAGKYFRAFEDFVHKVIKEADEEKDDGLISLLSGLGCYKFDGTAYKTIIDIALYNRYVNQLVKTDKFKQMVEKAREEKRLEEPIKDFQPKNKIKSIIFADELYRVVSDSEESASDDSEHKSSISVLSGGELTKKYNNSIKSAKMNAKLRRRKENGSLSKFIINADEAEEQRKRKPSLTKSAIFTSKKLSSSFIESPGKEQSEIVKNFNKANDFNEKIKYIKSLNDNDFKNLISTDDYSNIRKNLFDKGPVEFDDVVREKLTQLINETNESDLRNLLDGIKKSVLKLLVLELITDKSKQDTVKQIKEERKKQILTKSFIFE